jgi:PAS domain S-box-containing protein
MHQSLKVLIVEDSTFDAEAILRSLRQEGYELAESLVVDDPDELAQALTRRNWDIVISDYVMPTFNGTQALEIYQRYQLDAPFICVSGGIGEEKAAEVIRSGAHNYVSKSHLARLGVVVEQELAAAVKRRERRQVAELTARLAAIVEGTADAIFSRDIAGTILTWNSAAEVMYGYTAAEAIGKTVSIIVPPERQPELAEILEKLKRGERIERMETTRRRKDGAMVDVAMTISPVKDDAGRVIGASIIARDITERRRLEMERLKLIDDLQQALAQVKQLSGLLPICSGCKRIRDEKGDWQQVEVYVHAHSQADFTHGICPDCTKSLYPEIYSKMNGPENS